MRYIITCIIIALKLPLFGQISNHQKLYHLETIDCPEGMHCEQKTHNRKLLFQQVFNKHGQLVEEYLRTSDSSFLYTSYYLMDHFKLITKPSFYGSKTRGTLLISDRSIGPQKKATSPETYETYFYHDTILIPIYKWLTRTYAGNIQTIENFNASGLKDGLWRQHNRFGPTIQMTYQDDSLLHTSYIDEMSAESSDKKPLQKLQGEWIVKSQWDNQYMSEIGIGERREKPYLNCFVYEFKGQKLCISEIKQGKKMAKKEKYSVQFDGDEGLLITNQTQSTKLKILYLSERKIYFISTD